MEWSAEDRRWMRVAIRAARLGRGRTHPNPRVGAVAVRDGRLIGIGAHLACGGAHAEASILAVRGSAALRGATVYLTLEPCAHQGRTPPCAPALVAARIGRLVAAIGDPHPLVSGRGFACLESAGIPVERGLGAGAAAKLNAPFLWHLETGLPLITLKVAASLDGRQAAEDRSSQWISSPAARERVHLWRAAADAILTGRGTLVADRPRLTARPSRDPLAHLRRRVLSPDPPPTWPPQPVRVVVDSRARVAQDGALLDHLTQAPGPGWIVACGARAQRRDRDALAARGIETWEIPEEHGGGGVDLRALAARMAARGWLEVMAESGPTLANALLRERLVGRLRLIQAPLLLGGPWTWTRALGVESLSEAERLEGLRVTRSGPDALLSAWKPEVARCLERAAGRAGAAAGETVCSPD